MPDSQSLLAYRVDQLQQGLNEASAKRGDIYKRLEKIETLQAVQTAQYEEIIKSLNELKDEVSILANKSSNNWDTLMKSIITGLSGGILGYITSKLFS